MPSAPDAPFALFEPVPRAEWDARVRADLKGRDPSALDWDTGEGFVLHPFYRREDVADLPHLAAASGRIPSHRTPRTGTAWRLCTPLDAVPADALADTARAAREGGADALSLRLAGPDDPRLGALLEAAAGLPLHLGVTRDPGALLDRLLARPEGTPPVVVRHDPFLHGTPDDVRAFVPYFERATAHAPAAAWVTADLRFENGRDAGPVLGTALALAVFADALDALTDAGHDAADAATRLQIVAPVGTSVLLGAAFLRALRLSTARLVAAFGAAEAPPVVIHAVTGGADDTRYAPYTNLLRRTYQSAAAVLGGCDTLTTTPHDAVPGGGSGEALRLARNVGLLLRHEAHLDAPADPAGGAYHFETATDRIAAAAWERFLEIEDRGGLAAARADGTVDRLLDERAERRAEEVAARRRVLVGTNRYAHIDERRLDAGPPPDTDDARAAAPFERMRLRTERRAADDRPPRVVLLPYGDPAVRGARAAFARDVFAAAGFEVTTADGHDDPDALARAAAQADADVLVLCGGDGDYGALLPRVRGALQDTDERGLVYLAGAPDRTAAGADGYVHLGMNVLAALTELQDTLGLDA